MSGLTWLAQHLPGGPTGAQAAGVATAWLLLLAIPLSLLIAYRSTREVVGSRAVCAILALGWASAPPLLSGLDSGRVGPVVVHLLAPPIIVGVLLSLRPGHRGTSAAWLAALLTAVAAWFVPAMVLLGAVAGVVVALGARRWSRLRGVPLALLPLALLGPQVLTVVADPVLIFGGAGASAASVDSLAAWQALLLHPGGAVPLTLWWIAPAWILAFAAVVQRSAPTRSAQASGLLVTALVGAAAAVAASLGQLGRLPTGYAEAQLPLTPWPGTFLSVAGAALLIAAGLGATEVLSAIRSHSPRHAVLGALGVMLMAVAAAGSLGTMVWQGTQSIGGSLAIAQEPLPAIVAERAEGPDQLRILQLAPITASPDSAYTVDYRLQSAEPARWLSDRTWDLAQASAAGPEEHQVTADASHALAELVADVVDTDPATGADQTSLEGDLADLAVGFVQVDASADHPLVAQVDRVPSLVRVSSATDVALWRVLPDVAGSRVWVQAPDGAALGAVSSQGPHGRTRAEIPQFAPGEGQDAAADG
ncbi:MAG: hypothetical protein H0U62_10900, partial [Actinobacteria bacterium]|nr:hypothetical protein [Actinomycetota bacterium]